MKTLQSDFILKWDIAYYMPAQQPKGHNTCINKIWSDAKFFSLSTSTKVCIYFSDDGHLEAGQPKEHPV